MLPDTLDRTVEEHDCGDPALGTKDQVLEYLREQRLNIAPKPQRIGIEERQQVDCICWLKLLHRLKRGAQRECRPAFDIDLCKLIMSAVDGRSGAAKCAGQGHLCVVCLGDA